GAFAVRRGAIAVARQLTRDDIGILAELDAALQRGIARLDGEALALRGGKLRLEARDIGLERRRAASQRQRRARHGGKAQPPEVDLAHRLGSVIRVRGHAALSYHRLCRRDLTLVEPVSSHGCSRPRYGERKYKNKKFRLPNNTRTGAM